MEAPSKFRVKRPESLQLNFSTAIPIDAPLISEKTFVAPIILSWESAASDRAIQFSAFKMAHNPTAQSSTGWASLAIMPVQRFMRYPMLADAIAKAIPIDSPIREIYDGLACDLKAAVAKFNEEVREIEIAEAARYMKEYGIVGEEVVGSAGIGELKMWGVVKRVKPGSRQVGRPILLFLYEKVAAMVRTSANGGEISHATAKMDQKVLKRLRKCSAGDVLPVHSLSMETDSEEDTTPEVSHGAGAGGVGSWYRTVKLRGAHVVQAAGGAIRFSGADARVHFSGIPLEEMFAPPPSPVPIEIVPPTPTPRRPSPPSKLFGFSYSIPQAENSKLKKARRKDYVWEVGAPEQADTWRRKLALLLGVPRKGSVMLSIKGEEKEGGGGM